MSSILTAELPMIARFSSRAEQGEAPQPRLRSSGKRAGAAEVAIQGSVSAGWSIQAVQKAQ